jgi:hypothetical protein
MKLKEKIIANEMYKDIDIKFPPKKEKKTEEQKAQEKKEKSDKAKAERAFDKKYTPIINALNKGFVTVRDRIKKNEFDTFTKANKEFKKIFRDALEKWEEEEAERLDDEDFEFDEDDQEKLTDMYYTPLSEKLKTIFNK